MYVLSEVCIEKTVNVKAGQNHVHWPAVAGGDRACESAALATLDTFLPFLSHPALNIPLYKLTKISLSPDSCTREES